MELEQGRWPVEVPQMEGPFVSPSCVSLTVRGESNTGASSATLLREGEHSDLPDAALLPSDLRRFLSVGSDLDETFR